MSDEKALSKENEGLAISQRLMFLREKHFGPRGKKRFAQELGIPLSSYATYEAGRTPSPELLVKVSQVTGCDLGWLMTGQVQSLPNSCRDPETSQILARMERLISSEPKAKEAVKALMDLLAGGVQAVDASVNTSNKMIPSVVIPILGRAAASLPGVWIDRESMPEQTFEGMIEKLDSRKMISRLPQPVIGAEAPYSPMGQVQMFQLADVVDVEGLSIDGFLRTDVLTPRGKLLAMRIDGNSMEPELRTGDLVIADTGQPAQSGQIALVEMTDRVGVTCKIIFRERNSVRLSPLNRDAETASMGPEKIRFAFRVIGVVRQR